MLFDFLKNLVSLEEKVPLSHKTKYVSPILLQFF